MPQKRSNPKPPPVMTWTKASPLLIVGGIFDALRYLFLSFWFFGPALAALYCTSKASSVVGTAIGGLACGAGATVVGYFTAPALIAFGTVMAIAVGFSGWLIVTFFIFATNRRALGENPLSILWLFEGLGASVLVMVWGIYRAQIKKERAILKKYEQEQTAQQAQVAIY